MSQTYAKMIFELCIIQWYKADMAIHGEYALFLPLKFEKIEKSVKFPRGIEPRPTVWKSGIQTTRPQNLILDLMDIILYEYHFTIVRLI